MYGTPQLAAGYSTYPALSRRATARRRRLGSITPDAAAQLAMPQNTISKTAGFTQTVYNDIVQAAATGNFTDFNPSGCAGIKPSGAKIAIAAGSSAAGSLVLKFSGGNPILLGVGAGLLVGGAIFNAIFGHHAAAVARDQKIICAVVPAASDSLTAIDQAVQSGTLSPADAMAALDQLLASFKSQVAAIIKNDSSHCNAACVWVKQLTAIVAKKKADYADLGQSSSAGGIISSVQQVAAGAGLPSWVLPAGAFFLLWKVL